MASISAVNEDWKILDEENFQGGPDVRIISHENFNAEDWVHFQHVEPGLLMAKLQNFKKVLYPLLALKMLLKADQGSVVIVNGGVTPLWFWCGIFNVLPWVGRKKIVCWDVFVEYILGSEKRIKLLPFIKISTRLKEKIARVILKNYTINIVWSKKQVSTHAKHFDLPEHKFLFIPYKSNHSKRASYEIPINNFVFSGGNGKRDYETLVEAVRGTDIPLIISATDPQVRKSIKPLPNVVVLGAPEPAFAQLQAASRFVVIPMIYSGLKGGGEANFCNAMWHGKAVVAADSIAAEDYIVDGQTGYVVASGDVDGLRGRILELWNNPELCARIGINARRHVEAWFTHKKFIKRLFRLAILCGCDSDV